MLVDTDVFVVITLTSCYLASLARFHSISCRLLSRGGLPFPTVALLQAELVPVAASTPASSTVFFHFVKLCDFLVNSFANTSHSQTTTKFRSLAVVDAAQQYHCRFGHPVIQSGLPHVL